MIPTSWNGIQKTARISSHVIERQDFTSLSDLPKRRVQG